MSMKHYMIVEPPITNVDTDRKCMCGFPFLPMSKLQKQQKQ